MKKFYYFLLTPFFCCTLFATATAQEHPDTAVRLNQYGVAVERTPLMAENRGGILVLESKDLNYKVWFDARVQVDAAVFTGDTYNEIGNGLSVRRARFAMKTSFRKNWYAEIDLDFSNSEIELKDAYLKYDFLNGFDMKAGNFKEGFSMESTTTSRYLTFIERPSVVSAFAPSRHIGYALHYQKDWFMAVGGIHFQDIGGVEERTFSKDKNKDYGVDEGYSFTGKMVLMPFVSQTNYGLHLGAAASYRTPLTSNEVIGSMRYSTRSLSSINRKKYLDTDDITDVHHTLLGGFELAGYYKNFKLQGEYIMANVERKFGLETEKFNGYYLFGSWMIFGGQYRYNPDEGEFTQPGRGKKWGDLELALRYDYLDLNSRPEGIMGGAGEGYTLGLNFHANNNVKIMFNYAWLNHDRYANGKGKLYVGHDAAGNLTTNPKDVVEADGQAGEDYNMFSLRIEVDF